MMAQNTEQKTTYYLEMAGRDDLRLPERTGTAFEIRRVEIACPEFNWFLHDAVGVDFNSAAVAASVAAASVRGGIKSFNSRNSSM